MNEQLMIEIRKAAYSFGNEGTHHKIYEAIPNDVILEHGKFNVIFTLAKMIRTNQIRVKTEIVEKRHRR